MREKRKLILWCKKYQTNNKQQSSFCLPAISFSAERASHRSSKTSKTQNRKKLNLYKKIVQYYMFVKNSSYSYVCFLKASLPRYLWSSLSDLIRRSIFGSKNFRNILLAFAEINLKSFGVRLIGNDELVHCKYFRYLGSSVAAFCHGRHPMCMCIKYNFLCDDDVIFFFIQVKKKSRKKKEKEREKWIQFYEKSFVSCFSSTSKLAHEKWPKICSAFLEEYFLVIKLANLKHSPKLKRKKFPFLRSLNSEKKSFFPHHFSLIFRVKKRSEELSTGMLNT